MIDKLLQVLSVKKGGKRKHADKIKKVYHEKIKAHVPCEECGEGMMYIKRLVRIIQDINPCNWYSNVKTISLT